MREANIHFWGELITLTPDFQDKKYLFFCGSPDGSYYTEQVCMEFPFECLTDHIQTTPSAMVSDVKQWSQDQMSGPSPEIHAMHGQTGIFHPRIWNGKRAGLSAERLATSATILSGTLTAARLLLEKLFDLFSVVEPVGDINLNAYGHRIRELLLLACMEVESSWSGILKANDYSTSRRHFDTTDYVKLCRAMQLNKYQVSFPLYHGVSAFSPFQDWTETRPTESLGWYHAYNAAKHDRENNIARATLQQAIFAVGALGVMISSQFGPESVPNGMTVTMLSTNPAKLYLPDRALFQRMAPHKFGNRDLHIARSEEIWNPAPFNFSSDNSRTPKPP